MFRVKICGVRTVEQAEMIADAGVDAIGLNFYDKSARRVDDQTAPLISRAVAGRLLTVGLFVNDPVERIRQAVRDCGLNAVQLHGDEPLSMVAELAPTPVVLARRLAAADIEPFAQQLAALDADALPAALLVDAAVPGHYGGSGQQADWDALAGHDRWTRGLPLILAGGLRPENVAVGIGRVRPYGVDTASGVESGPGVKAPDQVRAFASAALAALG